MQWNYREYGDSMENILKMGYAIDQGVPEFAPFDFMCDGKKIQLKAKDADGTGLYRDKRTGRLQSGRIQIARKNVLDP